MTEAKGMVAAGGTDAALRSAASDPEAAGALVGALFRRHSRMVYGICRLFLHDRAEAEDATQQTFLSAHRSVLKGTVPRDGAAWLATIARHECGARLRRRSFETVALDDADGAAAADDPTRIAELDAEVEALSQALAALPRSQRQAIVLREFYGLTYEELAAALGVTGPAVESLLFRSRRRLQARLRPLRRAAGVLSLPIGLRETLEAAIPGFGPSASGAGTAGVGSALLAKLTAPAATKLAAAVVAVGTVGTVAAVDRSRPTSIPVARAAGFAAGKAAAAPAPAPFASVEEAIVEDRQSGPSASGPPPATERGGRGPGPAGAPSTDERADKRERARSSGRGPRASESRGSGSFEERSGDSGSSGPSSGSGSERTDASASESRGSGSFEERSGDSGSSGPSSGSGSERTDPSDSGSPGEGDGDSGGGGSSGEG